MESHHVAVGTAVNSGCYRKADRSNTRVVQYPVRPILAARTNLAPYVRGPYGPIQYLYCIKHNILYTCYIQYIIYHIQYGIFSFI